jgi:hypothetical protein
VIVRVIREPTIGPTTPGVVFVNDRFTCFSMEDPIREVKGKPVDHWKVPGVTAIPAGRYRISITHSPKFHRLMPEVMGVPGFTKVRIHPGNTHGDADGCLMFGTSRVNGFTPRSSREICDEMQDQMEAYLGIGQQVWLQVENPLSWG